MIAGRSSGSLVRHFTYLGTRIPGAGISFAFTFGLALTGLLAETLGLRTAVVAYIVLAAATLLLFPHFAVKANARNALLWAYPFWLLIAVFWSTEQADAIHSVIAILGSLLGICFVGALPDRRAVNTGLAVALSLFICYSAIVGHVWQVGADQMFTGVIARKNQFGHLAALEILSLLGMFCWAQGRFRIPVLLMIAFALLAGMASLLASHATGSLLAMIISTCCFVALLLFRRVAPLIRILLVAIIISAIVIYMTFGKVIEDQVFSTILVKFGKDSTLTGRTALWETADVLIAKHPLIGNGPDSFWSVNNADAWVIWREMGVEPNTGFTFHNSFRDLLVEVGWIGLTLFIFGVIWHFLRAFVRALASGDVIDACRVSMVIYFLIRTPVETVSYSAFTMDMIPWIAFLCIPVTAGSRWREAVLAKKPMRTAPQRIERAPAAIRSRTPIRTASALPLFRSD